MTKTKQQLEAVVMIFDCASYNNMSKIMQILCLLVLKAQNKSWDSFQSFGKVYPKKQSLTRIEMVLHYKHLNAMGWQFIHPPTSLLTQHQYAAEDGHLALLCEDHAE